MWDNASTVTFLLDNKTPINIVSSFALPNSIQFAAMPSNSNNEPLRDCSNSSQCKVFCSNCN
jgi:hypothetical protein